MFGQKEYNNKKTEKNRNKDNYQKGKKYNYKKE